MIQLSLSVRIVEAACKTRLNLPFEDVVAIARETGYSAICMRASAGGVDAPRAQLEEMRACVEEHGLFIAMVTADSNVPLNNADGPNSLRAIAPSLDVASALGCDLIRVCLKRDEDVQHAHSAVRAAAERGIRLAHQCHTDSLFEEVPAMLEILERIDNPNFGVIYEPANLLLCGQSYGSDTLRQLQPHLMNVYIQNHRLNPEGAASLPTFCRGQVRFDHLDPWEPGGVDFPEMAAALRDVGYEGTLTIHQAQGLATYDDALNFARSCGDYFRPLLAD